MTDAATFWNKAAPKYAKSPIADQAAYEYTLGRTKSYLTATDKVLELGCGTGSTALLIAPHVGQIEAADISPGMIDIAEGKRQSEGVSNLTFHVAEGVPSGGPYDAILAFNLLHLLPDMTQTLSEIHAKLAPGGVFISKSVCLRGMGWSLRACLIRAIVLGLPIARLLGKAPYVRMMSVAALESAVAGAGFDIIESGSHPKGPPAARYIVARKPA